MQTTIIIAVIAALVIVLLLVLLLLYAKAKLTSSGEVTIDINDGERTLSVATGDSLLSTLASQEIFLPSACGGQGTCGMCKCQVLEGGGDILPTEISHFSYKQRKEHWRLGCQVKVKENMKIHVPEAVLGVKKWECTVVSNHNVATFIKQFVVKLPEGENLNFRSGGYIQIEGVYLGTLLKMVGITYIAEFASGICKDAGYSALGVQIEIFGKLSILAVSAPVLLALFETLQGLMG